MNDCERWIDLQGPQPPDIRALFDAARDRPPMSPELSDELDRRVFAAIAADRRREARRQSARNAVKVGVGVGVLAACVAAALWLGSVLQAAPPAAILVRPRGSAVDFSPTLGAQIGVMPATPGPVVSPAPRPSAVRAPRR